MAGPRHGLFTAAARRILQMSGPRPHVARVASRSDAYSSPTYNATHVPAKTTLRARKSPVVRLSNSKRRENFAVCCGFLQAVRRAGLRCQIGGGRRRVQHQRDKQSKNEKGKKPEPHYCRCRKIPDVIQKLLGI